MKPGIFPFSTASVFNTVDHVPLSCLLRRAMPWLHNLALNVLACTSCMSCNIRGGSSGDVAYANRVLVSTLPTQSPLSYHVTELGRQRVDHGLDVGSFHLVGGALATVGVLVLERVLLLNFFGATDAGAVGGVVDESGAVDVGRALLHNGLAEGALDLAVWGQRGDGCMAEEILPAGQVGARAGIGFNGRGWGVWVGSLGGFDVEIVRVDAVGEFGGSGWRYGVPRAGVVVGGAGAGRCARCGAGIRSRAALIAAVVATMSAAVGAAVIPTVASGQTTVVAVASTEDFGDGWIVAGW